MTEECKLQVIDNAIETINAINDALYQQLLALEGKTQEEIDAIIINEINPRINAMLADLRESLVAGLKKSYQGVLKTIEKLKPVNDSDPTAFNLDNLKAIIDAVMAIKDFIITVYQDLMAFTALLTSHLAQLTAAIASVPKIPSVNFNLDKLQIKMEPITLADITG